MRFIELKKSLNSGEVSQCYFCYGDDEFVVFHAVSLIKGVATGLKEFNVADGEFTDSDLMQEVARLPVMSEKRVVVARGGVDCDKISAYLKAPNPACVLVLVKVVPHSNWGAKSKDEPKIPLGATAVDCNRLDERHIRQFVDKRLNELNAAITDEAFLVLCKRCSMYLTRINKEIDKLACLNPDTAITADDVINNVKGDVEFVVFDLSERIAKGDCDGAFKIIDGIYKTDDYYPTYSMLYNRYKRMFAYISSGDASVLGNSSYMAGQLKKEAAHYGKRKLKELVDLLAEYDYRSKLSLIDGKDALYSFVVKAVS